MQKKIDSSNLVYANILTKLGLVYYHLQKYDEAIFNYTESLGLIEKLEGKESMEYGRTLGNLGNTFVAQKKYGQAR
jgi:tetratricopeptide (TPR) repeat protein